MRRKSLLYYTVLICLANPTAKKMSANFADVLQKVLYRFVELVESRVKKRVMPLFQEAKWLRKERHLRLRPSLKEGEG